MNLKASLHIVTLVVAVSLLSAAVTGCSYIGEGAFAPQGSQIATVNNTFDDLETADDFKEAIAKYGEIAESDAADTEKAEAHLKLSLLYCHPRNPGVNYDKALKELEKYRELVPEKADSFTIESRMNILRDMTKLIQTTADQKKEIDALKGRNKELEEQIEQLKVLDVQIEEKRKEVK